MSAPLSKIYICNSLALNSRYEHTIYFDSESAQKSYFMGKVVKTFTHYTYLRHTWNIKVNATMTDAKAWSYLFFQNGIDPKYYYYFINQINYINDNTVELVLEMDVMQTFLFDFDLLPCLVERTHTPTDEIGEHTIDEGVDTGELTCYNATDLTALNDLCLLICSSVNLQVISAGGSSQNCYGSLVDGVFSGVGWFALDMDSSYISFADLLTKDPTVADAIVTMFLYPKALVQIDGNDAWGDTTNGAIKQVVGTKSISGSISAPSTVDGYTPRCKKLLCYPYNFLFVSNNTGAGGVFRYERTTGNELNYDVHGAIGAEGVIRLTPKNYDGLSTNYDAGVSLGGFPTCAWNSDTFKIWLAQNQNVHQLNDIQNALTIGAGMGTAIAGMVTMNPVMIMGGAGAAVNGVMNHSAQIAQVEDRKMQPPQAHGTHSTNVNLRRGKQTFTLIRKGVTKENAKIIDDFFFRYGYKINRVQTPVLKNRANFTFIKTNGCNIRGNINNEATTKITRIFDNGITFWVNGENIGLYNSVSNSCL